MARLVVKNGPQKDMCNDEIRLHAQNKNTILGLRLNVEKKNKHRYSYQCEFEPCSKVDLTPILRGPM